MKHIYPRFDINIYDGRFAEIHVHNDGTEVFRVIKGKKVVDTFINHITARGDTPTPTDVVKVAELFFNRLAEHPWLYKTYQEA